MENGIEIPLAGVGLLDGLAAQERLYFFLDYDGTLAEFAPTPDVLIPNPELVQLIADLVDLPGVRVATVSGRRLEHIARLLPVTGLAIAGTYGLEIESPDGRRLVRAGLDGFQAYIAKLKPVLSDLLAGRGGFFLEDKTWSLAIHAKYAGADEMVLVFARAKALAVDLGVPEGMRFLGGDRFLEISPQVADKGLAVQEIYRSYPLPGALPVYAGDDDKDEAGFHAVSQMGGVNIVVMAVDRPTQADYRVQSPAEMRAWLRGLIERRTRLVGK